MAPKQSLAPDSIAVELASDSVADDSLMLKLVARDSMAVELASDSTANDNITSKLITPDSASLEDVPDSTTPKLAAPTSEFLEWCRTPRCCRQALLFVLVVIVFMKTVDCGIVHTRVVGHVPAAVLYTLNTW
jgi:hypothetical protein